MKANIIELVAENPVEDLEPNNIVEVHSLVQAYRRNPKAKDLQSLLKDVKEDDTPKCLEDAMDSFLLLRE